MFPRIFFVFACSFEISLSLWWFSQNVSCQNLRNLFLPATDPWTKKKRLALPKGEDEARRSSQLAGASGTHQIVILIIRLFCMGVKPSTTPNLKTDRLRSKPICNDFTVFRNNISDLRTRKLIRNKVVFRGLRKP
jgi:hypothetical protein